MTYNMTIILTENKESKTMFLFVFLGKRLLRGRLKISDCQLNEKLSFRGEGESKQKPYFRLDSTKFMYQYFRFLSEYFTKFSTFV